MRAPKTSACAGLPAAPAGTVRTCPERAALVSDPPGAGQLLASPLMLRCHAVAGAGGGHGRAQNGRKFGRQRHRVPQAAHGRTAVIGARVCRCCARKQRRCWVPHMDGTAPAPLSSACLRACPCSTQKLACIFALPACLYLAAPTCWPMCCSLFCLSVQRTPRTPFTLLSSVVCM